MNADERDQAIRLGRAWDAFVSGTGSREIAPELLAEIQFAQEVLAVPAPAPGVRATTWQQVAGRSLAASVSGASVAGSPNGIAGRHDLAPTAPARLSPAWLTIWRLLAVAALGGFVAGFMAGIWTRLAMRVAGFLTADRNRGLLTEADARVGEITFGGTLFLAVSGAAIGILGGVLYVAIRHWLPRSPLLRAGSYGLLLLAVFGFVLMDENNTDYQLFGPAWLNVGTFSLTYIVYGVLASLAVEFFDRRVPAFTLARFTTRRAWLGVLALSPFGLFGAVAVILVVIAGMGSEVAALIMLFLLLAPALRWLALRLPWKERLKDPALARFGLATACIPILFGVYLTFQGISGILTG